MSFDVIVIGAGHNGLVAATKLKGSGRRVLLLEARERLGGLAAVEEFHPGYRVPGLLHDTGRLRPWVVEDLGLASHGLEWAAEEAPVLIPDPERGEGILLYRDAERGAEEIGRRSAHDARAYREWRGFLGRVGPFVSAILDREPPPLKARSMADLWSLGRQGLALRRLGRRDMTELIRALPICAADWLEERFQTGLLSEGIAGSAAVGVFTGPGSAGSAANILLQECITGREVKGGPGAMVLALEKAAKASGVQIRTGARVDRLRIAEGRARAVVLSSGEEIEARSILSTVDPKTTFLRWIDPMHLELRCEQAFRNVRARGSTAKVHLALSGPLDLGPTEGPRVGAARIGGGSLDALERVFDCAKYGKIAPDPYLDLRVPTVSVSGLAPEGHHVASILVSFVPYEPEGGWCESRREELGRSVLNVLAKHVPTVRDRVVGMEVLVPPDLEARYGIWGGHLYHGEHALDQLFSMRPVPAAAQYRAPIAGLFLGGSGSHPGGGITGAPGWLAAQAVLSE